MGSFLCFFKLNLLKLVKNIFKIYITIKNGLCVFVYFFFGDTGLQIITGSILSGLWFAMYAWLQKIYLDVIMIVFSTAVTLMGGIFVYVVTLVLLGDDVNSTLSEKQRPAFIVRCCSVFFKT